MKTYNPDKSEMKRMSRGLTNHADKSVSQTTRQAVWFFNSCGNFLPLLLLLAFSVNVFAEDATKSKRSTERQTYSQRAASAPGKILYVEMSQANVIISGEAQNEIVAEATVELSVARSELVKDFFSQTQLVLEPYRQGFRLELRSPKERYERRADQGIRRLVNLLFEGDADGFSMATELSVRIPSNQSVVIENKYGDVTIDNVNGALQIDNTSGAVMVKGCEGSLDLKNNYAGAEVRDFKGAVTIGNSSGAVTAANIAGNVRIENSYKPVRFERITGSLTIDGQSSDVSGARVSGDCFITTSYKPISVAGVGGKLTVNGQSCTVTVSGVRQDALIESSYQPIRVDSVGGALTINGQSSAVTANVVANDATIRSSYQSISVQQVGGILSIDGSSCEVTVRDVKKDVSILSSYKTIRVDNVAGSLKVDGGSCSVLVDNVGGNVDIINSYKYVMLKRTAGSIDVRGDSSPIEVSQITKVPADGRINLITTYKPVTLSLPASAAVQISARTQYGKIRSDFPVYLNNDEDEGKAIKLELGTGGALVRVETSGDIVLRKE
jgi:hypothetical protein